MIPQELREIKYRKIKYDIKTHYESYRTISRQMHDLELENQFEKEVTTTLKRFEKIDARYTMRSKQKEPYEKELNLLINQIRDEIKRGNLSYTGGIEQLNQVFKAASKEITPWVEERFLRSKAHFDLLRHFDQIDEDLRRESKKEAEERAKEPLVTRWIDANRPVIKDFAVEFIVIHWQSRKPIPGITLKGSVNTAYGKRNQTSITDKRGSVRFSDLGKGRVSLQNDIKKKSVENTVRFVKISEDSSNIDFDNPIMDHPWSDMINVVKHQVEDKDSFYKISKKYAIGVDPILLFNWGFTEKNRIEQLLPETVGSNQVSDDGKTPVFSSQDVPGVIYIPQNLLIEKLWPQVTYIVEVEPVGFSTGYDLCDCT